MSLDPGLRARYLDMLGIDAWVPRLSRNSAPRPAPAIEVPAVASPAGRTTSRAEPAPAVVSGVEAGPVDDWATVRAEVLACTRCALHGTRTQAVFASGDRTARWMVIGEAPGAEEDRQGEPFVGRAGQLLDAMMAAIGLRRPDVFVTNMIKCRPPQNRDPKPEELSACRPYLERQVRLLRPALILVVGRIAAQNLLTTDASLARLRGQVHRVAWLNTPAIVTYHPAYLLRTPADKRKAWEDLKFARRTFAGLAASASR